MFRNKKKSEDTEPKKEEDILSDELIETHLESGYKVCKIYHSNLHLASDPKDQWKCYVFFLMNKDNIRKVLLRMTDRRKEYHIKSVRHCTFYLERVIPWLAGYNFDNIPFNFEEIGNNEVNFYKQLQDNKFELMEEFLFSIK